MMMNKNLTLCFNALERVREDKSGLLLKFTYISKVMCNPGDSKLSYTLQEQCYQQIMNMFMKISIDAGSIAYSAEPSINDKTEGYR